MKNNTRSYSSFQEKGVSKKFGTNVQIASGATPFYKGDGIDEHLFIECKTKMSPSKSVTIKKEWIDKAKEQATQMRKGNFILVINFGEQNWNGTMKDYVVMEDHYFEHLYKCAKVVDAIIEDELGGVLMEGFAIDESAEMRNRLRKIINETL